MSTDNSLREGPNKDDDGSGLLNPATSGKSSPLQNLERMVTCLLLSTTLKPRYYLRKQLFLSFGITSFLALCFFVMIGVFTAILSGQSIMSEARQVQEELARHTVGTSARYVAETVTKIFSNLETGSDILRQVTQGPSLGNWLVLSPEDMLHLQLLPELL
jgi:hypothetical protein